MQEFVNELMKLYTIEGRNEAAFNIRKINVQKSEEDRSLSVWETEPEQSQELFNLCLSPLVIWIRLKTNG